MLISSKASATLSDRISRENEIFCQGLFLSARWFVASQAARKGLQLIILPDRESAEAWSEYASRGIVTDKTPPAAPFNLKATPEGNRLRLTWKADADIESGIGCFQIYVNDEQIGRVPEQGNYQDFDRNGDQARPVTPPAMEYLLPLPASTATIAIETVNRDGLTSSKAEIVYKL